VRLAIWAALLVAGLAGGVLLGRASTGETTVTEAVTTTVTTTAVETSRPPGLPGPVARTHAALLAAAEAGDYEALRALLPDDGFRYTFGEEVAGGPIAYWRNLQDGMGGRPLEALAAVLRLPYVLARGLYVWPFAYTLTGDDELTGHERELLETVGGAQLIVPGTGYLGWRAGIEPDGDWVFFIAGD
jgi:hypothetical protein